MFRIKNLTDTMVTIGTKMRRSLNHLIVEGSIRTWFLSKPKHFELHIYYSNTKEKIIDYKLYTTTNLTIQELNVTFVNGDNIDKVYKWVTERGFKIEADYKK
jgi:hypothetical protein